ncbi:flagellar biosynthetic protein FliO [Nitratireductor kimnyeongensis]|uniref:Flagellar biosynthetic protein FliO n=1 Tax=Nitratireductor kimnyeongensis TaxID=430679 RepID=A0ABW0T9V8_9HYPH|nr:flagellar biosynthetic protein FliO [Nitratireductor kimnyeongensis]QZZ35662.1 flagellar biosynthetic protein FliO [Nitratireductor kimnyeongensis]
MRDWLVGIFGEAYATAAFWTIILIAVAIVLLVFVRVNRRFTAGTFISGSRNRQPRLAVTDATPVDNNRRLVLVRRDEVEHLILIGGPTDLVIEANIGQANAEKVTPKVPTREKQPSQDKPEPLVVEEPSSERDFPRSTPSSGRPEMPEFGHRPATPDREIQIASRSTATPAPRRYPAEATQAARDSVTSISSRPAVAATSAGTLASVTTPAPKREPDVEHVSDKLQVPDDTEVAGTIDAPVVDLGVSRAQRPSNHESTNEHTLEDEMSKLLEELSEQKH